MRRRGIRAALVSGLAATLLAVPVVGHDECASDAGRDALSDAEHFGAFLGHWADIYPTLATLQEELRSTPGPAFEGDYEGFLAALTADPDALATRLAVADRFIVWLDDELAWLESHPPRLCWAEVHEKLRGWLEGMAAALRGFISAVRTEDPEALRQVMRDAGPIEAPDVFTDLYPVQTCWQVPGAQVKEHDDSPFAPLTGRVERPEDGYVITFPDGWVAQELTDEVYWAMYAEPPAKGWTPYLYATRRGTEPSATCALHGFAEFALEPPAFESAEDAARFWADEGDDVRSFHFAAGPVTRVRETPESGGTNEAYFFQQADQWVHLSCFTPEPGEDPERMARSFEFLPAE